MADIEKISVGGTSYDVRDALAAHSLTDIATAGSNITFDRDIQDNYSVQGSLTINNGVASGFSTSNYIYKDEIWNTIVNAGSFTFQSKFKVTEGSPSNVLIYNQDSSSNNNFLIGCCDTLGRAAVIINGTTYYSAQNRVVTGVDYWLRFTYDSTTPSILVELSTDGSTFNTVISPSSVRTIGPMGSPARIGMLPNNGGFKGSIDLVETSFVDSNGDPLWKLAGLQSDKLIVNATVPSITVDQTYNASSTNAQSGVAINGAKFVRNTATVNTSLTLQGSANSYSQSINIGYGSSAAVNSVALGHGALASGTNPWNVAVGQDARTGGLGGGVAVGGQTRATGPSSVSIGYVAQATKEACISLGAGANTSFDYSIAIGNDSTASSDYALSMGRYSSAAGANSIAIGGGSNNSSLNTYASGSYSIAIGGTARSTSNYAIQLGYGSNDTANTFSVGLSDSNNYRLLESDGTIPSARMPSDVLKNIATGSDSICILGNASGDASGSRSVAIGTDSYASQNNCVAIGNYAAATGYTSVAVGMCQATANYAIQLGTGKNDDANTFSVGLSTSTNYRLLNSDGTIPYERLPIATSVDSTSTNSQVVGAKLFYDTCGNITALINAL